MGTRPDVDTAPDTIGEHRPMERLRTHPGRLQAVVVAAVALITAFGINWSAEQVAAVTTFSAAVIALLLEPPAKLTRER